MGFDRTAWGDKVTDTSTTAQYTLGTLRWAEHPTYGEVMWRYVKNDEAATNFVQGDVIQAKASTLAWATGILAATAKLPRHHVIGVADHTIAFGSYGWIICLGRCQVECAAAVVANDTIMCDGTAGRAKTVTVANPDEVAGAFGIALEASSGAGALVDCKISCL